MANNSSFLDDIARGGGIYNSVTGQISAPGDTAVSGGSSSMDFSPLSRWPAQMPAAAAGNAASTLSTRWASTPATVFPRTSFTAGGPSTPMIAVARPDAPTAPNLPALKLPGFQMPERDEKREKFLTARASRPGMARLDQALTRALGLGQHVDNPVARAEHARRTIEGYAGGVSDVMASAGNQGRAAYGAERAEDISAAQTNYQVSQANAQAAHQAEVQKIMADFDIASKTYLINLQDYLNQPLGQRAAVGNTGSGSVGQTTWRKTDVPGLLSRA